MHAVELKIRIVFKSEEHAANGARYLTSQLEELEGTLGPDLGQDGAESYEWEVTRRSLP